MLNEVEPNRVMHVIVDERAEAGRTPPAESRAAMTLPDQTPLQVSEICAESTRRSWNEHFLGPGGMKNAHTRPNRKTFHFERTRLFGEQVEVLIVRG